MKSLNLTDFPLDGLSLIEASAGTGKTYALANLYLRYLLERQFTVEQILVVTFTEAATQELKDRIRLRIQELRAAFDVGESQDPILNYLVERSASPDKDQLLLRLAERQIDQAQIHTIHGFCQQTLKRHALDSNVPLKQSLLEDQAQLRKQVVEDFWRRYVLSLDKDALQFLVKAWSEPDDLLQALAPLLNRSPESVIPQATGRALEAWQNAFETHKTWYLSLKTKTLAMLDEVIAVLKETPLKANAKKLEWLGRMKGWAEASTLDFSLPTTGKDSLFERFTTSRVLLETPKNKPSPEHPYFDFLETHFEQVLPDIYPLFIAQSYPLVRELIDQAKHQQGVFSFDDLISRVADALKPKSETGVAITEQSYETHNLAALIAAPYQVALIDEFQDTDPAQYFIFNRLFGTHSPKSEARLVLIGDPKQAIYGFRGGDIKTYLQAKRDISNHANGHVFTMDTNWRSSPSMVSAVNAIFTYPENAFKAEDIPFQAVKAAKKNLAGLPSQALLISRFPVNKETKKPEIEAALAVHCAQKIKTLVQQSSSLTLDDRPLKHSDIAVLVRSGKEGEVMKQALADQGLIATLDSQSSIYHSEEARALYFLLAAVADPKDEQALRRCLAEPFFGVSDEQILAFNEQASVFAYYLNQFEYLHQKWQRSGVLAMIRESLRCLRVFEFWHQQQVSLSDSDNGGKYLSRFWERSLTNWNQLAEILQKQSRTQKGHFALLRWYKDTLSASLSNASKGDEESKLRLESDAQLIRIVTIHKSKGLEYPFVFIPFMFACRGAMEAWFYDEQGKLCIDLSKAESSLVAAEQERLAEDIRLLYVALTRAKYQCYVGTAAYTSNLTLSLGLRQSAWAYLLFQANVPTKIDDELLEQQLIQFQQAYPELIHIESIEEQGDIDDAGMSHESLGKNVEGFSAAVLQANQLSRSIHDDWRVQSFTGLMNESHHMHKHRVNSLDLLAKRQTSATAGMQTSKDRISIFNFPKGSQAGTFLHTLFEHLNFEQGELLTDLQQQYSSLKQFIHTKLKLARLVEEHELDAWSDYLSTWVQSVLNATLADGICLSQLSETQYFSEMQFYFSVAQLQSQRFNYLLKHYLDTDSEIDFSSFEGHIKGAIDLVFEAHGKFYILDYKSNYLGDDIADYHSDALAMAMEEHRYDVQYLIYSLAVHRFLKQRKQTAYNYEEHFGGVIYLFLRGLNLDGEQDTNQSSGIYFARPPFELILAMDQEVGRL